MMMFIEVTENDEKVLLNTAHVMRVAKEWNGNTRITMQGFDDDVVVSEDYDTVKQLMYPAVRVEGI